jgi:hypothetical protein
MLADSTKHWIQGRSMTQSSRQIPPILIAVIAVVVGATLTFAEVTQCTDFGLVRVCRFGIHPPFHASPAKVTAGLAAALAVALLLSYANRLETRRAARPSAGVRDS